MILANRRLNIHFTWLYYQAISIIIMAICFVQLLSSAPGYAFVRLRPQLPSPDGSGTSDSERNSFPPKGKRKNHRL